MKPLEALGSSSAEIALVLASGTAPDVEAALAALEGRPGADGLHHASLAFAKAAFALREGRLETARVGFEDAAKEFESRGEAEASELAKIESAIARARRGRREAALEAEAIVAPLEEGGSSEEVRARAILTRGTAMRVLGDASRAQACFARALSLSKHLPDVRSNALNSLGTLCVSLGAFGAADTLCEHAAELCRTKKDVVGEAIAMGQLGAAALGRGDLAQARRYLSRQEWLANRIGDAIGRTRALVWLAEVALEAGRADDAAMLAGRALESASSVTPPLTTFAAYADRALGRARLSMGEAAGKDDILRACATFTSQRLPLGEALSARDAALAQDPIDRPAVLKALSSLAGLGLPERIAEVLAPLEASPDMELAVVAPSARRLEPLEARLVYEQPEALASVAEARSASRKNLSRLAVLALSEPGLIVAAVVVAAETEAATLIDETQIGCALIGGFPTLALFAWPSSAEPDAIGADLSRIRDRARGAIRVAVGVFPEARVTTPGFGGGLGATVPGLDPWSIIRTAHEAGAGTAVLTGAASAEPLRAALHKHGF